MGKDSSLIHIGGWKKLENKKISREVFNDKINQVLGVKKKNIFDIYGFTELMGIIYPSSDLDLKTTSLFADVIVRHPSTMEPLPNGEEGILEFISPMPYSYPGLAITTDDLGIIYGYNDDPKKGLCGKKFQITGRAKNAEIRGCGDIMSEFVEVRIS